MAIVRPCVPLLLLSIAALGACSGDSPDKSTETTETTPYSDCTLTVQTIDTPRVMPRDKSACFFRWTWTVKPAPTTITTFEVETTRLSAGADDGPPDAMRIGVIEDFASTNVLFEDQVRFDSTEDNREIYDLNPGWRGWFAPNTPLEMPSGAWFIELITDWDNCNDTEEITLTFEDPIGDDCGDVVDTGSTKD